MSLTAGQISLGGGPCALISSSLQCHERNLIDRLARRRALPGRRLLEGVRRRQPTVLVKVPVTVTAESGQTGTVAKSYSEVAESDCDHHVGRLPAFVAALVYHISAG